MQKHLMARTAARDLRPIAARHITAAKSVDQGVLYATISAGMVLARRYLTGRGVDQDFANRYGSPFGRTAAEIYRTEHGTEPRKAWSLVSGKWRRVNGFLPTETATLDTAFVTYKRTAEYVVTETVTTADEPAVDQHRIPGCDGAWHYDGVCEATLADLATPGATLIVNVSSEEDQTTHLVVWEGDDGRDLLRTTSRGAALAFADRIRRLADAIEQGAHLLAPAATDMEVAA